MDAELGIFLVFLCYTGCRLNEGLRLTCDRLILGEAFAYIEQTKNDDPRGVHLPPYLVAQLANHPRGLDRGKQKVFRFRKCGRLYTLMAKAKEAAGPDLAFVSFHILCHTWAT
ncbi:tyrosine-type recombinase/integrase [Mesorhizobium escarrei]|uniref:tyrosine-type recombinase/integrase n=1 Tax=Mesorhizobium escarrei TaxID=666018 RepID=UPI0020A7E723|nr:tyrosine-type recombinase/integrase [Mesorhizobium escarrei]